MFNKNSRVRYIGISHGDVWTGRCGVIDATFISSNGIMSPCVTVKWDVTPMSTKSIYSSVNMNDLELE